VDLGTTLAKEGGKRREKKKGDRRPLKRGKKEGEGEGKEERRTGCRSADQVSCLFRFFARILYAEKKEKGEEKKRKVDCRKGNKGKRETGKNRGP